MLATLVVIAAMTYAPGTIPPIVGATEPRDALLATPAPWPSGRPVSADRAEIGRLWSTRSRVGSRTPLREATRAEPGAAAYGAPVSSIDQRIYARAGHTIVALDPWSRISGGGTLETLELARNQWLREQGYILRVRTHMNRPAGNLRAEITPRATIELHDEPSPRRSRMRVSTEPAGGEVTRVSLPPHMAPAGPAIVADVGPSLAGQSPSE